MGDDDGVEENFEDGGFEAVEYDFAGGVDFFGLRVDVEKDSLDPGGRNRVLESEEEHACVLGECHVFVLIISMFIMII